MANAPIAYEVADVYASQFNNQYVMVKSPGRINIIGEHTDYNEGFVLPAAIDKAAYVAVGQRDDNIISLVSTAFNERLEFNTNEIVRTGKGWPDYILGVVDQLNKNGHQQGGFNLVIDGDIPIGSGMSSSAAFECATIFGLNEIFNLGISKMDMAFMAQKAEHTFAGVMCGIMDQFSSLFGKKDHAIKLDCRSLQYEYKPFNFRNTSILLLNTNVSHSLASSEYNNRRSQCAKGVELVSEKFPDVKSLRDVTLAMLKECVEKTDLQTFTRCKYVIEENDRLQRACDALEKNDLASLGKEMYSSHHGLSSEYEVSCDELDFLVNQVKDIEGVWGARMMGGGFGGCTINIVERDKIDELIQKVSPAYFAAFDRSLTAHIANVEDGTSVIQL